MNSVQNCLHQISSPAGGARTQTSWNQGNFRRLKRRFVLTVPSEMTQSVLTVQDFNLSLQHRAAQCRKKKSHPAGYLSELAVFSGGFRGACVFFNNGWWCFGAQPGFFYYECVLQRHQKWAEWFLAALWMIPLLFPWLWLKCVWLIIAARHPGWLQTSGVMCICDSCRTKFTERQHLVFVI